jgi:hypothetical protein
MRRAWNCCKRTHGRRRDIIASAAVQAPGQGDYYRTLFRDLAYAAVED